MPNDAPHSRRHRTERTSRLSRSEQRLIEDLLQEAPRRQARRTARPQLRTTADQQRLALRGFLLRTWLDRVLLIAEAVFLLVLIAAAAYWFTDTYGRDWLYEWRHQQTLPTDVQPIPTPLSVSTDDIALALPYSVPDEAAADDEFLVEQPIARRPVPGDPRPQRIVIPAIGLETSVYEVFVVDGVWQVAEYAAGYHHGSALPGETGNTVLAGHAGLRGAVFQDLDRLTIGDEIQLDSADWSYTYRVRDLTEVWPTQVEVMDPTTSPVLTLITCTNWDTQRLIVVADLIASRPRS